MMIDGIMDLLRETFEGPKGNGSWFTESKPGSELFGTINLLSTDEASILVEGVTIAAHTHHTRYHLWANNQLLEGKEQDLNWEESWKIGAVTGDQWDQIKNDLYREYLKMIEHINEEQNLTPSRAPILISALAHAAYHLGAIRQMVKVVK